MLATAVGNYPKIANRPDGQKLRRAINRLDRGELAPEELAQVEDEVTREVIREQEEAGLDLVTDGMVRWDDGQTYLARRIEGFKVTGLIRYFDTNTYYRQPVDTGPHRWTGPMTVRDYQFATTCTSLPVKAILTGPYTLAKLSRTDHHPGLLELALELAEALRQETLALEGAGASLVQFDEPAIVRNKEDWELFQQVIERLTEGLSVKRLLYTWFGDATDLPGFFQLPFHGFGLDFVWGPANFDLLKGFPADKELGLGIVDARNVKLETVEYLAQTIRDTMRYVSSGRIYLNPSCGLDYLPRETAFAKLKRMVEGMNAVKEAVG
ncbi:MAG: methylcobamide--CoM methyltransferase [Dehalococcoidia bacterium]